MTWGTAIWGTGLWGGAPLAASTNLSFEIAEATEQGQAHSWDVQSDTGIVGRGLFDGDIGLHTWQSAADFEQLWRLPYVVHETPDLVNTASVINASDLASAILLANHIKLQYNKHRGLGGPIHLVPDITNLVTTEDASDSATTIALVNAIRIALNAHVAEWTTIHRREDVLAEVTTDPASDTATAITLINAIKYAYNGHLLRQGFGTTNSDAKFEYASADLDAAIFSFGGLAVENFEAHWSIPDMFPVSDDQSVMVSTDAEPSFAPSHVIDVFLGSASGVQPVSVRSGFNVSWPDGHVQFLNDFNMVDSQPAFPPEGETFDADWFLPGSVGTYPNDTFLFNYYDAVTDTWGFGVADLVTGFFASGESTEDFEDSWTGQTYSAKFWSGTEWRFLPGEGVHLEYGYMDSGYTYDSFDPSDWTLTLT